MLLLFQLISIQPHNCGLNICDAMVMMMMMILSIFIMACKHPNKHYNVNVFVDSHIVSRSFSTFECF